MDAFELMRADPRFRGIARLLVELGECHAERTPLEVETVAEFLRALFQGRALACVASGEMASYLVYAAEIVSRDGRIDARVFDTTADAEAWLSTVN